MSKLLIDTNVLVYAIDADSKYYHPSRELLLNTNHELFTSSKNISEFLSVVTRFQKALSIEDALSAVENFSNFITIIYPDTHSQVIFKKLLKYYKPHGLAVHDLEIAAIAISNEIDFIATFNKKDFAQLKEIAIWDF